MTAVDAQDYYTPNGQGNNPLHPQWGAFGTGLHPLTNNSTNTTTQTLPSPHKILVELLQNVPPRTNPQSSQLLLTFGFFVTHDIVRTKKEFHPSNDMSIECDDRETRGDVCPMGAQHMDFYRVKKDEHGNPINYATAWLDMDHVYGNVEEGVEQYYKYRVGEGGLMKLESRTGLPPLSVPAKETEEGNSKTSTSSGFGREQLQYLVYAPQFRNLPGDLGMLSTFLHYHNKRARHHAQQHPEWSDEQLYQAARMDTIAVYQVLIDHFYISGIIGTTLDSKYEGYNPEINPGVDVFFAGCTSRYGHSSISSMVRLIDEEGDELPHYPLLLRDVHGRTEDVLNRQISFFQEDNNTVVIDPKRAVSSVLRGLAMEPKRATDAFFGDDMTLFFGGVVLNDIQRGRDFGVPSYNMMREKLGLEKLNSYLELADGNVVVADALESLYGVDNIDDVDAYVGGFLEAPMQYHELGSLIEASFRDQFTRLRDGDHHWYENRLSREEIDALPTLADLFRDAWGENEMKLLPDNVFKLVGSESVQTQQQARSMELLDGEVVVEWEGEESYVDFTIHVDVPMRGGYFGLGWGSNAMKGAEIWFCEYNPNVLRSLTPCSGEVASNPNEHAFSCCVAPGMNHVRPECDPTYTYLTVLDSCSSSEDASLRVRAELCADNAGGGPKKDCFHHGSAGNVDFIAAINPNALVAHGFSHRMTGTTNLISGMAATCSSEDSAQAGLFALHGITLLFAWLVLAPIAIYVVRYMKDKSWRLKVHISLVGAIGGLMLALVTSALVSVEGTAFGTEDAESAHASPHKIFGLSVMCMVVFMITTGELRRSKILVKKTKSLLAERVVIISHRIGGLVLVGLAWYNCYTGLVQISPYEGDSIEVTFFSHYNVAMGYDMETFGVLRKYIFFPWIALIIIIFAVAEIKMRLKRREHTKQINMLKRGEAGQIIDLEENVETMPLDTFLFLTKHGHSLTVIDGYVVDLTSFIHIHPGGTNVLKFAIGSDVTQYFIGELDVNGIRHTHDVHAVRVLKTLIKAKLEKSDMENAKTPSTRRRRSSIIPFRRAGRRETSTRAHFFRSALILKHERISVSCSTEDKYIIRLRIGIPREAQGRDGVLGTPLPTSTFIFRENDVVNGEAFERPYTPASAILDDGNSAKGRKLPSWALTASLTTSFGTDASESEKDDKMIAYDFFITIVPGGKMSTLLANKKEGSHLLVKGPLVNNNFLERIEHRQVNQIVIICQGTGISPALQLCANNLMKADPPMITLVWCVKNGSGIESKTDLRQWEKVHSNFRYVAIDKNETLATAAMFSTEDIKLDDSVGGSKVDEARRKFTELYLSDGISNKGTTEALLTWATCSDSEEWMENEIIEEKNEDEHRFPDLIVALCGHPELEVCYPPVLNTVGVSNEQIFLFPAGSMPLSEYMANARTRIQTERQKNPTHSYYPIRKSFSVARNIPVTRSQEQEEQMEQFNFADEVNEAAAEVTASDDV